MHHHTLYIQELAVFFFVSDSLALELLTGPAQGPYLLENKEEGKSEWRLFHLVTNGKAS